MSGLLDVQPAQRVEYAEDSKAYAKLLMAALRAESECAAYRECLKNTYREKSPKMRRKIARHMIENGPAKRGKELLKVVKAACIVGHFMHHGTDEQFTRALSAMEETLIRFPMEGATIRKWITQDVKGIENAR